MGGSLEGRVAVITAGSTGIGFGIAEAFIAEGASVVLGNRSEEKGAYALERLKAGDRALFKKCDALVRTEVDALVDYAVEKFGKLDIMVNCAGGSDGWALVGDLSDEAWLKGLEWNASTAFWGTRRALKYMLPAGYGRIINIASIEGKVASKVAVSHYIAGKHAMIGLTKATAVEYGTTGVTCNAICPGWVLTPLVQKQLDDRAKAGNMTMEAATTQLLGEKEPSLQFTTPEELGALAVFFCSPAGNNVRGVAWNMDGGWVAQ